MGALFGFTALVVHSFVDFGLHIPAIAFLATVLCAHLCALGSARSQPIKGRRRQTTGPPAEQAQDWEQGQHSRPFGGLAPFVGAIGVVMFTIPAVYEGWRVYRIKQLFFA